MKTKAILIILFLFLKVFYINAQTNFSYEDIEDLFKEEIKSHESFDFPVKSVSEDISVLDSSIHVNYKRNYNDTTRYYYKYDNKGNVIEEMNYCNTEANVPINYKYQYTYDENGNVTTSIYLFLNLNIKQWYIYGKKETIYHDYGNRTESFYFLYDTITNNWIQFQKSDIIYDDNGREISTTKYQLNESQEWYPIQKEETSFDEQGRLLGVFWYNWDESQMKLEYSSKHVREYSENGNQVAIIFYYYDKNISKWVEDDRTEIVNENGKTIEYVNYEWDNDLNQWVYNYMYEWSYDSHGNETSYSSFSWDSNENIWKKINNRSSSFSYNSKGLLESVSNFVMDSTGQWIGTDRKEYLYNDEGSEILAISSVWDENTDDWVYGSKFEKEYNSNNKEVTSIGHKWDVTINDWVFSTKNEKEYNSSNQITLTATYNWNNDQEEWIITGKNLYEFDIYGHNTKASKYVVYKDDVLELKQTNEYFYSQLTANANTVSLEIQTIKVYPNPTNETFTIETQNPEISIAKIFDSNGQLIKNLMIYQGVNTYNISYLKSGVYFIQIPQKEVTVTKKLVKN